MAKPFNERVKSALSTDRVTITDLQSLVAEAKIERSRLIGIAEQAGGDSLNFALSEADRDEAAAITEKSRREADALSRAITTLDAKLTEKRESAAQKARADERAAIMTERDTLAERLCTRWPAIEAEIVEILGAIKASDARMREAGIFDASAEAVARNCPGNFSIGPSPVRRLTEMKLPSFSAPRELAWPRPVNFTGGSDRAVRQARLNHEKAKEAERAKWSRYHVIPPNSARSAVMVDTRNGPLDVRGRAATLVMTQEAVDAARKLGCQVELAKPNETIGFQQSASFL